MVCGQCAAALPPDNDFVTCKGVSRGFHYSCTNVRETSWRKKSVEDKALWRCSFCKAEPEGAIQQTVTPVALEQGEAAILAFLETQQRKQEKEKEEDQERMRREKEEDQERRRQEREEDQERLDGRFDGIGNLLTKQNEKIEDVKSELVVQIQSKTEEVKNELAVQIQSKTEAVKTELAVQIQSKAAEVETKLEAQIQRKADEVREELEDQMQRFRERIEGQLEGDQGRSHLEHRPVQTVGHSIKPPTYDGSTSRGMYKQQFEATALSNRWSDEEKAKLW